MRGRKFFVIVELQIIHKKLKNQQWKLKFLGVNLIRKQIFI